MNLSPANRYLLNEIASLLKPGQRAYLVGGAVRDILLGRETSDVDLAVSGDAEGMARAIASKFHGSAFALDRERGAYRVSLTPPIPPLKLRGGTKRGVMKGAQVDVTLLAGDIDDDLARRDFTVNAMATPLGPHGVVVDPFNGRADLEAKLLRAVSERSLSADPARLVRAFRLARDLDFEIEEATLAAITGQAGLVRAVAGERVRDEVYLILMGGRSADVFRAMAEAGLLREIMPETAPMEGLLLNHSLAAMSYAEAILGELSRYFGGRESEIESYLQMQIDGGLTMSGLIELCAFLHDVGKPPTMKQEGGRIRFIAHDAEGSKLNLGIAARLKMSGRAARTLAATAAGHMRPLHMSKEGATRHALYRFCRDMGDNAVATLIVTLADALATRDEPGRTETDVEGVVRASAGYYYGEFRRVREEPLIRGGDLITLFGLTPGPLFHDILGEVEEKRAEGLIKDREDAIRYLRERLKT